MVQALSFRPIAAGDRAAMEAIRRAERRPQSTYTFPVLFSWRDVLGFSVCLWEDAFLVKMGSSGPRDYLFPCGAPDSARALLEGCAAVDGGLRLHFLGESDAQTMRGWFPDRRLRLTPTPEDSDYIARSSDLSRLKGGGMRHIRKDILIFRRGASLSQRPITSSELGSVLDITERWSEDQRQGASYADDIPVREAVAHWDELGLSGSVFYRGAECVAYLIGSELSEDTYDIHFAKCADHTRGMDYESKHLFFAELESRYSYVNMEEDMGLPGLRQRKLLLKPCAVVPAFCCELSLEETSL